MRNFNLSFFMAFVVLMSFPIDAMGKVETKTTIADYMCNDTAHAVIIEQPAELNQLLLPAANMGKTKTGSGSRVGIRGSKKGTGGYRIQVFSDRNARTARSEAMRKRSVIASKFPSLRTYVSYKAPTWRLRVGDFKTSGEASAMLKEIRAAFPSYSRGLRIVRDRIITDK